MKRDLSATLKRFRSLDQRPMKIDDDGLACKDNLSCMDFDLHLDGHAGAAALSPAQ